MQYTTSLQPILLYRFTFIISLVAVTWLALIDASEMTILSRWDKFFHAGTFVILSFLLNHSFHYAGNPLRPHLAQAGFLLVYGVAIEWLQSYTPFREASSLDVVADAAGIIGYGLARARIYAGQSHSQDG